MYNGRDIGVYFPPRVTGDQNYLSVYRWDCDLTIAFAYSISYIIQSAILVEAFFVCVERARVCKLFVSYLLRHLELIDFNVIIVNERCVRTECTYLYPLSGAILQMVKRYK